MSGYKVVESVNSAGPGSLKKGALPVLDFVRQHPQLSSVLSKATPDRDRVAQKDSKGDRLLTGPDSTVLNNIHRSTVRRNKDNQVTLQMLPDLNLCFDILVSLTMSPKDMFNDKITIKSDCSKLLPASILLSLLQVSEDHFNRKNQLSNFVERMLYRVMRDWGSLPLVIIPENALDDVINNYNQNLTAGLEAFQKEMDLKTGFARSGEYLGVPDYLIDPARKNTTNPNVRRFASQVSMDLQSFDTYREVRQIPGVQDSYINFTKLMASNESLVSIGDDGKTHSMDDLISVSDNISTLKMPEIRQMAMESRIDELHRKKGMNKLSASLESAYADLHQRVREVNVSARRLNHTEIEKLIFKKRKFANTPIAVLRNNSQLRRTSIGEPLKRELDPACFIPVSIPGEPERKLGGYIMIDPESGNPLTTDGSPVDEIVDLSNYATGKGNFVSSMNDRAKELYSGKECNPQTGFMTRQFLTQIFEDLVEKDLLDRMKNGQYSNGVKLGRNEDFFWLMLTRCLKGNRTQLLWVPEEYLVYFALEYDEMGFGRSMLDDMRNLTSMRIMLQVAGLTTSIRNSIGRTKVMIEFDEENPDAAKSFEEIQDEIVKSRVSPIPFGINNIADISKYIQRSCYEFEITGNSGLPNLKIDFEQFNTNYPMPDETLAENLKDLSIQRLGLTRDQVDGAENAEFAIQIATSNALTMRRIQRIQRAIEPQIAEYLRKYSMNSESQLQALREIISANYENFQTEKLKSYFGLEDDTLLKDEKFKNVVVEQALAEYLTNLYVEMPSPATSTLEAQKEAFDNAKEFYEAVMEIMIPSSFFDPALQGEEASQRIDGVRESFVALYMREWLSDNAVLPELGELMSFDEEGRVATNILDTLEKHLKALGMSLGVFLQRFRSHAELMDKLMQGIGESTTDSGGDSSDSSDEGGGDEDLFGDMGGLDDMEETTEEDEEGEESEEEESSTTSEDEEPQE